MYNKRKHQLLYVEIFMDSFSMYWNYSRLAGNYHKQGIYLLVILLIEATIQSKLSNFYFAIKSNIPKIYFCLEETTNLDKLLLFMGSMMK